LSVRRFFIPHGAVTDGSVTIDGDLYRHMAKVLRLKCGDQVLLADGSGREYHGAIRSIGREMLVVDILDTDREGVDEQGLAITLYQGLPKGDRTDVIIQKATELGIAEIVLFRSSRSVPRIKEAEKDGKIARWQRIALEAARQSGRSSVPAVSLAEGIDVALEGAGHAVKLLLWEEERNNRLKQVLGSHRLPGTIALLVGPEGGLTEAEAAHAQKAGFMPVSLGKRIVRTETASLAMLAILQFYWGDMG
jgi:16S rRNA (uracil1498-N3)-methyltransferase